LLNANHCKFGIREENTLVIHHRDTKTGICASLTVVRFPATANIQNVDMS